MGLFNFTKRDNSIADTIVGNSPSVLKKKISDPFAGMTNNEIVEEIHETFFTEVDRLLAAAGIKGSLHTEKQELMNKDARLQNLGFSYTSISFEV